MLPIAVPVADTICAVSCGSEGLLTHSVMTCEVILEPASPNSRARPKSAILSSPLEAINRLFGFRSYP